MALFKNSKISKTWLILLGICGITGLGLIIFGLFNIMSTQLHQKKEQHDLTVQSQVLKDEIKYMLDASLKKQNYLQQLSEELDSISRRSQSIKYLLDSNKEENEKIKQALAQARQELFGGKGSQAKNTSFNKSTQNSKKDRPEYLAQDESSDLGYDDLKKRIESIREDLDDAKQALANRTLGDPAFKDEVKRQQLQLEKNYALVNKLHEQISNMVLTQQAMEEFSNMMSELEMSARDYKSVMHKLK